MRFDCWMRSHCWDLAQDDGQFDSARRWPVVFPSFSTSCAASLPRVGMLNLCCSLKTWHTHPLSFAAHRQSTRMALVLMKSRSRSSGIVLGCSLRSSWLCRYVKRLERANLLSVGKAYRRCMYSLRDALLFYIISFIFNPKYDA